jgi:predicted Zn-dependent protease with MMP-like domain
VQRRRRDRHGRGPRGALAPRGVPLSRTRSEAFDDLVLDAVEQLETNWAAEVAQFEFAVEDVPNVTDEFDPQAVMDRGVTLGRLYQDRADGGHGPLIVIYRRPLEARALDRDDLGDLAFAVVAELVAQALGMDVDELDPPHD